MKKMRWNTAVFALYCAVMLLLLFCRARPDTAAPGFLYRDWVKTHTHLIPLSTIRGFLHVLTRPQEYLSWMGVDTYRINCRHAFVNLVGNVMMFVPLGFFPPRVRSSFQRLWKTLLLAAVVMILVEVTQVLTLLGNCDIDDLILNLSGTAIGYGIYRLIQHS